MPTLRIPSFQGISPRKDGTLQEAVNGFANIAFNVDPYQREGALISALDPGDLTTTGSAPKLVKIVQSADDDLWGTTVVNQGIWTLAFGGSNWTKVSGATTSTVSTHYGIAYYRDYIYYVSGLTTLGRYGPLSGTPVVDNTWQTLSDGRGSLMFVKNDVLWIGKQAVTSDISVTLSSFESDGVTETFAEDDLILSTGYGNVTAMGESRDLLLTAIGRKVVAWDGNEEGFNYILEFDDDVTAITYAENVSYIFTQKSVYSFTQDSGVRHLIEIPDRLRGGNEMTSITVTDAAPFNKLVVFGNHKTLGQGDKPYSLWAFPRVQYAKNPMPFEYYRESAVAGTSADTGVWAVFPDGDNLVFSGVDSSNVAFIKKITGAGDRASGEWATVYMDFNFPDFDKDIYNVDVMHDTLASGDSVEIEFAVDHTDTYTSKLVSNTVGTTRKSIGLNGIRGRKIAVKLKTEGEVKVRDLSIGYRILPKTV